MRCIIKIILILFIGAKTTYSQSPDLRRICPNGADNNLYWTNPIDTCRQFAFNIIWERKGPIGQFFPIDTIYNTTQESYLHFNATPPLSEPNSNYFIERRDSCGPDYNQYSDTLLVDVFPPAISELDSVSVDIISNRVILGWSKNTSPDFDKYLLYVLVNGFLTAMTPSETRDTFAIDLGTTDPSKGSYTYNINTRDSCGKLPAFEQKHSTIFLSNTIDTCTKTYRLTWSHYIGWKAIKKYYIFKKINNNLFELVDSVNGNINTYQSEYATGNDYAFYVRAIKDTAIQITSSSNKVSFISRIRQDPTYLEITYITSGIPTNENLFLSFNTNKNDEVTKYELSILDERLNLISKNSLSKSDINTRINLGLSDKNRYHFYISAIDICNNISFVSDTSTNMVLSGSDINNTKSLTWNSYFTWNKGVDSYIIYRGSGDNGLFTLNPWKTKLDTSITDDEQNVTMLGEGICYYILAKEANNTSNISTSNRICLSASFIIHIPNAFTPDGINPNFRPEGTLIDYKKSSMKIYNRWGQLLYENSVNQGWNGKDANDATCEQGVYFYFLEIYSTKNEKQIKQGTFTLLR
jgi:gliding motility-associated-like protein